MRLLRGDIGLGMAGAYREASEAQATHELADTALVQVDLERQSDLPLQIGQPPPHHAVLCPIRAGAHPGGHCRLLRARQARPRTAAMRPVR